MTSNAYEIRDLVRVYRPKGQSPVYANKGINLDIPEGSIFGIFGPNGAGKTTLVRQMVGLLWPTEGVIRFFGKDIANHRSILPENVGYYGQRLSYLWAYTPLELLGITGQLRGMSAREAVTQAKSLIEMVGLAEKSKRMLSTFSGGEIRIVSVLTALMANPPVVVLDEPTADLDPVMRQRVWNILCSRNRDLGTTIILVTHNVLEAEKVVGHVAIIDEGKVVAQGTPWEIIDTLHDQVRVEVRLKNLSAGVPLLDAGWTEVRHGVFARSIARSEAVGLMYQLSTSSHSQDIEDMRLITPTLEDYYVKTVGKGWR